MWIDKIVEAIRQIRERYAKSFNYDLDAIFADLQQKQIQSGREVVSLKPKRSLASRGRTENAPQRKWDVSIQYISFVAKEKLQGLDDLPNGFLEGAPDLAIEILSPGNTVEEMHAKLVEYFENSARLV